jgi:hypothetical protein
MTVTNSSNKITYIGNSLTKQFPFTFKIFKSSDLQIILTDIETGIDTLLTSNYSVNVSSGYVIYPITGSAIASTTKITIFRQVPITQEVTLPNQGAYFAKTVEGSLDKSTIIDQQLHDELSRTLKFSVTSEDSVSKVLPNPVAGYVLGWNEDGTALENTIKFGTIDSKSIDGGNSRSVYLDKQKYDGGGANG